VVTASWATRIMTYVGSVSQQVPLMYAETWAGALHSYSYYNVESRTYVGSGSAPVPIVYAETHADAIDTQVYADSGTVLQNTRAGAITTTQEAGAITVVNTAANLLTHNFGIQEVFNLAPLTLTATVAGAIVALNVGPQFTVNVPEDKTISNIKDAIHNVLTRLHAVESKTSGVESHTCATQSTVTGVSNQVSATHLHACTDHGTVAGNVFCMGAQILQGQ
jgi:hypothetical protein